MVDRSIRIFDKQSQKMLYPQEGTALNIVLGLDGFPMQIGTSQQGEVLVRKLQDCIPMYKTGMYSVTKEPMWEGDIVECDITFDWGGIQSAKRTRGVMSWHPKKGGWTVQLPKGEAPDGIEFNVTNTMIIGDIYQTPNLIKL